MNDSFGMKRMEDEVIKVSSISPSLDKVDRDSERNHPALEEDKLLKKVIKILEKLIALDHKLINDKLIDYRK